MAADPFAEKSIQLNVVTFTAAHKVTVKESVAKETMKAWLERDPTSKLDLVIVPHHDGVLVADLSRVETMNAATSDTDAKRELVEALHV